MKHIDKGAVALEYGKNEAPIVSAKGEAEIADIIIEEAKKNLNWEPNIDRTIGLKKTIEYFDKLLKIKEI